MMKYREVPRPLLSLFDYSSKSNLTQPMSKFDFTAAFKNCDYNKFEYKQNKVLEKNKEVV